MDPFGNSSMEDVARIADRYESPGRGGGSGTFAFLHSATFWKWMSVALFLILLITLLSTVSFFDGNPDPKSSPKLKPIRPRPIPTAEPPAMKQLRAMGYVQGR